MDAKIAATCICCFLVGALVFTTLAPNKDTAVRKTFPVGLPAMATLSPPSVVAFSFFVIGDWGT